MSTVKLIPFASWEPDQAAYLGQQSTDALNVIPAKRGYRPFPAPLADPSLAAFPSTVQGAYTCKDSAGNVRTFAATTDKLYYSQSGTWSELGSGYALPAGELWSFAAYGDTLIATNFTDNPVYSSMTGGTVASFATLTDAPRARIATVIKDFVFLGALYGAENTVRWSGIDDPMSWETPGSTAAQTVQSDEQVFAGGKVLAIVPGWSGIDGIIFLDNAVYRATYVGPPFIFQFTPVDKARGIAAPNSAVVAGQKCYYLAEDGWVVTDGSTVSPIGAERVNNWFQDNVDTFRLREVRGAVDPTRMVVVWTFPGVGCSANYHDKALVYSYALDQWAHAEFDSEFIFEDRTQGYTLEDLDSLYTGILDTFPISLDSPLLSGGVLGLSVFDTSHQVSRLAGTPLAARIDTAETGGKRMLVQGLRPLVDSATPTCDLVWRDLQSQTGTAYGAQTPSTFDGIAYMHQSCRYARARVDIPADATWTNAVGVELVYDEEGTL